MQMNIEAMCKTIYEISFAFLIFNLFIFCFLLACLLLGFNFQVVVVEFKYVKVKKSK
jgi:hypothetical protein